MNEEGNRRSTLEQALTRTIEHPMVVAKQLAVDAHAAKARGETLPDPSSAGPVLSDVPGSRAADNPTWGHRRVQGELIKLGHRIAASTVWQTLHDARINPVPRRTGPTWRQFLTAQARGILAADFVHVNTVLLTRHYYGVSMP